MISWSLDPHILRFGVTVVLKHDLDIQEDTGLVIEFSWMESRAGRIWLGRTLLGN